jgi:hypothetical protein
MCILYRFNLSHWAPEQVLLFLGHVGCIFHAVPFVFEQLGSRALKADADKLIASMIVPLPPTERHHCLWVPVRRLACTCSLAAGSLWPMSVLDSEPQWDIEVAWILVQWATFVLYRSLWSLPAGGVGPAPENE